jgi:hypothetical protein
MTEAGNGRLEECTMNTTAISVSRLRLTSRFGWLERPRQFISLAKPRVMALSLFTAFVGLMIAPIHLEPLPGFIAILPIAAGAGAAGALNMWCDADIDAVMALAFGVLIVFLVQPGCTIAIAKGGAGSLVIMGNLNETMAHGAMMNFQMQR